MNNITGEQAVKMKRAPKKITFKSILLDYNTFIMLIVMVVISSIVSPSFFTDKNIFNVFRQISSSLAVAMGMLIVILTGGIDLSVGSIVAFGSVFLTTLLTNLGYSLFISILLTVVLGVILGLITGILVAYAKMAPFIASLAMMTIARGVAYIISNGSPIYTPQGTIDVFGSGVVNMGLQVPYPVFLSVFIIIIYILLLRYTAFGRITYAIGSNEDAARLAGIRVRIYKMAVYCISGGMAAIGGIIVASRTGIGSPVVGEGMELDAIAAVVIGGASMTGGKGTVLKTVIGVIIIGLIGNVMNLVGVPPYPQEVIKGVIIILAVLLQGFTQK